MLAVREAKEAHPYTHRLGIIGTYAEKGVEP
jgi:hypothetical protein